MALKRRMSALSLSDIKLTDPFWSRWQTVLVEVTLPSQYDQLESTGRLANFRRAAGKEEGTYTDTFWFNDSDVYKWLEACAYALATQHGSQSARQKLQQLATDVTKLLSEAQEDSGYINTFFQLKHPDLKFRNLNMMHELYCGGHLLEAGAAMYESTGDTQLLNIAKAFADHVLSIFGPSKRRGYCGHEEFEYGLIRLTRATGDTKYRDLARWMVEERGQRPSPLEQELSDEESLALAPWAKRTLLVDGKYSGEYYQDHAPIREHTEIVGHAVRAMYLYMAATDLADGQNDEALDSALQRIWSNLTKRRMYVTGGIGPSASNEGFTSDYDLPNLSAYAETCAACGLIFWGQELLEQTANAEYAEIIERALYNGALSGISLSGDHYFYDNPLESRGTHERTPWFSCACCPPNIARLIGSVGKYVMSTADDGIYLHLMAGFEATTTIKGVQVAIRVESGLPYNGNVKIHVNPEQPVTASLRLRLPEWAEDISTDLPGLTEEAEFEDGYAVFNKTWQKGDILTVEFEMEAKWLVCDPKVRDNLGRTALTYGPLVYCVEEKDLGFAPQLFVADTEAEVEVQKMTTLEGANVLTVYGSCDVELFPDQLYADEGTVEIRECTAKFIPYFAWNNRGKNSMQVWVRKL